MTILVGTSGDTGSAVIEAVRGSNMVDIVVLLPKGRCTKVAVHIKCLKFYSRLLLIDVRRGDSGLAGDTVF